MHIHGYPVAVGVVAFAAGASLWRYRRLHRVSAIFFAAAAALLVLGVVPWLDALAVLTASGIGITVLLLVDIVAGVGFWFEAVRKHMHHRIRTPVLALTFGTALILTIGSATRLLLAASRSPGKTGAALSQAMTQIQSGQAGRSTSPHAALIILACAAGALVFLIVMAHRHEGGGRKGAPRGAIAAALSAGKDHPALPSGRRR